jgi:hypothetical protein
VIPFAVLPRDLEVAAEGMAIQKNEAAQPARIIYVGAGGPIMIRSFTLFCRALSHLRMQHPDLVNRIKIDLYGTMLGWRKGDRRHLADLAGEHDVADLVSEDPSRVSYRRSLELLLEGDGAVVLGVDDAGYMPSKLFSYALSGKPLLASLRRDSPAFAAFNDMPELGNALWFDRWSEMPVTEATNAVRAFLQKVVARQTFDRRAILTSYFASAMARRHAQLFEACL